MHDCQMGPLTKSISYDILLFGLVLEFDIITGKSFHWACFVVSFGCEPNYVNAMPFPLHINVTLCSPLLSHIASNDLHTNEIQVYLGLIIGFKAGQEFDGWHARQKHTPNKNVRQVTYKLTIFICHVKDAQIICKSHDMLKIYFPCHIIYIYIWHCIMS